MAKEDKLIHIKLEYFEAVQSKKDLLETQKDLLRILQIIKTYHLLRIKELKTKEILARKVRSVKANLKKLNKNLPKIKLPEIISHEPEEKNQKKNKKETSGKDMKTRDLERELEDINKKLMSLNENF